MKTLSTILFVALIIVTGSEYGPSIKSKTVYLPENNISVFDDRSLEEDSNYNVGFDYQITLKEIPNNMEDLNYLEELEDANYTEDVRLNEIKLDLEDINYMMEYEDCEY